MNNTATNPYQVSSETLAMPVTARGFTERQCFWRFMAIGALAAFAGGPILVLLSRWRVDTWVQLIVPGILFGVGLWLATQRCIGDVSNRRKILLIGGCLFSFGVCGVVYELTLADRWWQQQPLTWSLIRSCVYGPAVGFACLVAIVRLAGGKVRPAVLFTVWMIGTFMGFTTLFVIDEWGWRRDRYEIELLAFAGSTFLQTGMTALIGWQLAAANAEHREAKVSREDASVP